MAYCQIPNGSIGPDFTANDINGNEHTLYADYLDQGKAAILDLSAAWCAPCWTYHQDGLLKDIYNQYGPDGTDELMVIFVEGESTNTLAQLNGVSTGNTRANSTQGDWVTGTPYPIIDNATIPGLYGLSFYPTVMIVRPDGKTLQSYSSDFPITSEFMAYAALNKATNDVMLSGQIDGGNSSGCGEVSPSVNVFNVGNADVTSFTVEMRDPQGNVINTLDWSGNMPVFGATSVNLPMITLPSSMDVEFVVINPNGMPDENMALNVETIEYKLIDSEATQINEAFENHTLPAEAPNNFLSTVPNNFATSIQASAFTNPPPSVGGFGMSTYSLLVNFYQWDPSNSASSGELISINNLDLSNVASGALIFDRAGAMYTGGSTDRMIIEFREGCEGTWTQVDSKSGAALATVGAQEAFFVPAANNWVTDTVDISAFDGLQDVQMRFRFLTAYGNNLYLDNIRTASVISAVQEVEALKELSIYPNPTSDMITIDFNLKSAEDLQIELTNMIGQRIMTIDQSNYQAGSNQIQQDLSSVPNGMYFVTFRKENQVSVQKINVIH